jgi:hypothetical protein
MARAGIEPPARGLSVQDKQAIDSALNEIVTMSNILPRQREISTGELKFEVQRIEEGNVFA